MANIVKNIDDAARTLGLTKPTVVVEKDTKAPGWEDDGKVTELFTRGVLVAVGITILEDDAMIRVRGQEAPRQR